MRGVAPTMRNLRAKGESAGFVPSAHPHRIPFVAWSALLLVALGLVLLGLFFAGRLLLSLQHEADLDAFRSTRKTLPSAAQLELPILQTRQPVAILPESEAAILPESQPIAVVAAHVGRADDARQSLWSERRRKLHRDTFIAYPDGARPAIEGVLRVAAVDLEVVVYAGTDDWTLDRGAGRIEGTPRLGADGNVGVAAHRDGFFRALKDIAVGDEIVVELADSTQHYAVVKTLIVEPEDTWVLAPTPVPTLTLVTCYPFYFVGNAPLRFVAQATLSGAEAL